MIPPKPQPPPEPARTFIIPPELIPDYLEHCREAFEAGDVWMAWEACFLAARYRHHGLPMPEWVLEYLEHAAGALAALSVTPDPPQPGPPRNAAIARALGLTTDGRGTVRDRYHQDEKERALATDVALILPSLNGREFAAYNAVASFHQLSESTVRDAYKAAVARGDRLDGLTVGVVMPDMVRNQALQVGGSIEGWQYPKGPRRTWIVEAMRPGTGGATIRVLCRLNPPPIEPT